LEVLGIINLRPAPGTSCIKLAYPNSSPKFNILTNNTGHPVKHFIISSTEVPNNNNYHITCGSILDNDTLVRSDNQCKLGFVQFFQLWPRTTKFAPNI
jgi:hypothetical protein